MPNELKFTSEQEAITEAMRCSQGEATSLVIEAGAGCAKSTTIEAGARGIRGPALAVAFGARDAERMGKKFPPNFLSKSFNSLGNGAWNRRVGFAKPDDKKMGNIVTQLGKDDGITWAGDNWLEVVRVASLAMHAGIVPEEFAHLGEGLTPNSEGEWLRIASDVVLDQSDAGVVVEYARRALVMDIEQALLAKISFDDQVYCPTLFGGQFPTFQNIVVDEDQDLSPLNVRMIERCMRGDAARVIAVGDRRQGIYAFRGALGDAADQLRLLRSARPWQEFPLMTTFRCPKVVVERQLRHVPGFTAWEGSPEGKVKSLIRLEGEGWNWQDIQGEAAEIAEAEGRTPSITVVCRNNGPLLSMAFKLIRQGISIQVLGREIGKGLIALSRKLVPDDGASALTCQMEIDKWRDEQTSELLANGKEEKIAGIADKAECLFAVLNGGARDAGTLRRMLESLFARTDGRVILSTIHKIKGHEADIVVLLDPWRIPSKWARRALEGGNGIPFEQEMNLRYVAETRTRRTLILADIGDFSII